MADEQVNPLSGDGSAATPPSSSGIDQSQYLAELQAVRAERDQLAAGLQQLRPYADDIEWLTADPQNAEFLRRSRKTYEQALAERDQVPAEMRPLAQKVDQLVEFTQELKKAQQQAAEEPQRKWLAEGRSFCEDLVRKYPDELGRQADPQFAWAGTLESYCRSKGVTWEEGWKKLAPSFVKTQNSPPPPSSRADAGMPGLPPPSRQPIAESASGQGKKLSQIVLERMQQTPA